MNDRAIKRAADLLKWIENHEREISDLQVSISRHREEIEKERAEIEKLKSGELTVNDRWQTVQP